MPINSFLYPGAKVTTGYEVANSLRFDDGSSEYLHRTPSSSGSSTNWTYSVWVKRSASISGDQRLLSNGNQQGSGSQDTGIIFMSDDTLRFDIYDSGTTRGNIDTKRTFRDLGAWYHFVFVWNSSSSTSTMNGSATDRMQIWVNGVQETELEGHTSSAPTIPAQDANDPNTNSTSYAMRIGTRATNQYFNGYIAEAVFVDGQSLGASSFGEFDEDSPTIWKPKDVSGLSLGTNGFYLDFEDSSSLGNDASGSNNLTVVNLTATDQSTDTPMNNYSTIGTLFTALNAPTYSEGNLQSYSTASGNYPIPSSIGVANGKWYMELKYAATTSNDNTGVGITHDPASANQANTDQGGYSINYYASSGYIDLYGSSGGTFSSYTVGDIIGIYMDIDNKKLYFAKNGTIQNSGTGLNITTSTTGFYYFQVNDFTSTSNYWTWQWNFGAGCPFTISSGNTDPNGYGNFEYSPNDGGSASFDSSAKDFYALNTKNLAEYG